MGAMPQPTQLPTRRRTTSSSSTATSSAPPPCALKMGSNSANIFSTIFIIFSVCILVYKSQPLIIFGIFRAYYFGKLFLKVLAYRAYGLLHLVFVYAGNGRNFRRGAGKETLFRALRLLQTNRPFFH